MTEVRPKFEREATLHVTATVYCSFEMYAAHMTAEAWLETTQAPVRTVISAFRAKGLHQPCQWVAISGWPPSLPHHKDVIRSNFTRLQSCHSSSNSVDVMASL